jgi:hypothetical protein
MAEAGPNYRRKHGLPDPKPKKPKTAAAAGANAVQVAALEQPAVAKTPRARTKKAVKVLAPGSLTAKTPGRVSPLVNLAQEAEEAEEEQLLSPNAGLFGPSREGTPNGANGRPLTVANARPLNGANSRPLGSPANRNGRAPLSPATYGYEDEGFDENTQARRVTVGGDEYFLQENGSLFKRSGNALEEWVGYLEPGGQIRYTNAPL